MIQERTRYLESQGYSVTRFWDDHMTKDIEGVILASIQALEEKP